MDFAADLLDTLRRARHAVALTGAGISAESGVPTFRDAQTGLWARYDPAALATPEAFADDPQLVWDWYAWRRALVAQAEPNGGHVALATWQSYARVSVVTQNVDGLHVRAGSTEVIELHGNLARTLCSRERRVIESWSPQQRPPRCPHCEAALRPDVVWFGEMLPQAALQDAFEAVAGADVVLSVGTSTLVQPAASLPFEAVRNGVPVLEINPSETPLTGQARWSLRGAAATTLPQLLACIEKPMES